MTNTCALPIAPTAIFFYLASPVIWFLASGLLIFLITRFFPEIISYITRDFIVFMGYGLALGFAKFFSKQGRDDLFIDFWSLMFKAGPRFMKLDTLEEQDRVSKHLIGLLEKRFGFDEALLYLEKIKE